MKKALITGITGQDGSYLTELLLEKGCEVHGIIRRLAAEGVAVIVISSDLPEVLALADRIITMREGRVTGEVMREHATQEKLMTLMTIGPRRAA